MVTGGAGFIGSAFVRLLLDEMADCRVLNFDALTYAGNPDNLEGLESDAGHRFVRGDIADRASMVGCCAKRASTRLSTSPPRATSTAPSTAHAVPRTNVSARRPARRRARGRRSDASSRSRPTRCYGTLARRARLLTRRRRWRRTAPTPPARPRPTCCPRRAPHARDGHGHHPLLEQLRPVQFPEKLIPLFSSTRWRTSRARLRRRPAGARLDPRARPLPRHRSPRCGAAGPAGLQLRRPERAAQHRRDPGS